ncbi:metalloregulator ArsR/SmtB family transcription factor [Candidatus Gracilibacteria bacterium]|nr:metalloregulator ArsR/SmtB family transcription factor [Candidatus Gracilibacteria bacterium]
MAIKFFAKESIDLDFVKEAFNLLKEPNRIKILSLLSKNKKLCVGEIEKALDLKQNLVSHHLSMFRRIGLVDSKREITKVYYMINKDNYKKLKKMISGIFNI